MILVKLPCKFFVFFWLGWEGAGVILRSFGGWGLHPFAKCGGSPACGDIKRRPGPSCLNDG